MKFSTASAVFFAASIALAVAVPARRAYYRPISYDADEYNGRSLLEATQPYTLATAPFFYQPRNLELSDITATGRAYKIVKKKKKNQGAPVPASDEEDESEEDEPQDEEGDESSEEEADEENDGEDEEFDTPPWEEMFPAQDQNSGSYNDRPGGPGGPPDQGGHGGQSGQEGGSLANLPGGAPAPESSGSLMDFLTGNSGSNSNEGPQNNQQGGPPGFRQGQGQRGGPPPYQAVRARTALGVSETPRSGGAVLYDGFQYIPIRPVHIRIPQREAKEIPEKKKAKARSGRPLNFRQNKKLNTKKQPYFLLPVERDSREIRFSRDEHGFKVEHGPLYAPSEIWRWEGPGGRPLRRRENRPSYPTRPQRGSSVRFTEEDDY